MIKKAVLPLLLAPFLMVFSTYAFSDPYFTAPWIYASGDFSSPSAACSAAVSGHNASKASQGYSTFYEFSGVVSNSSGFKCKVKICDSDGFGDGVDGSCNGTSVKYDIEKHGCDGSSYCDALSTNPDLLPIKTDDQCQSDNGDTIRVSTSSANALSAGGSFKTHGGACSVSSPGGVQACDSSGECVIDIESTSTDEYGEFKEESTLNGSWPDAGDSEGTFSVIDLNTPDYLNELPGGCSDSSSCVTIGDTSYLVDWDSAPDYFSYVDDSGTVHSKPSGGGSGGSDNGGSDPTDPTDPDGGNDGGSDPTDPDDNDNGGGDNSGGDDDGGSGGGSTVPDFEFDESGIIEAIGSAGQSNQNAINALSNDVTGALDNQTDDLNEATSTQTDALTDALGDQTNDVTSALDTQTNDLTGALDSLGTTFTEALDGLDLGSIGDDTGDGEGDGEGSGDDDEGDGLLGGISKLLNRMVNKLADTFTEDLGSGDDLFDSSGMDETLDGVAQEEDQYGDEVRGLMDEIGEDESSSIAEQVTSRLPSLPSGGCTPMQFGPMEISCRAFTTIQQWLTWIVYFWTVISVVDTFFRSSQRTA